VTTTDAVPDRRAALKARHREAILDAADALIGERGSRVFSVDELAERADVARRTVFNHFASLDDVVLTACTRLLTRTVDDFRTASAATPVGDGSPAALFAEFTTAMRGVDLPAVIAYLAGVIGDESDPRPQHLIQDVFTRTTEEISTEMAVRNPGVDGLEAQILVCSLLNGVALVADRWIDETGAALDDASRAAFDDLLDRLITTVRRGYAPGT